MEGVDTGRRPPDYVLLGAVMALVGIGAVMVFSSSFYSAQTVQQDPFFYLRREVAWIGLGVASMLAALAVEPHRWARALPWLFPAGVGLLLIVLRPIPGIVDPINGATRWIDLGPFLLQPSEFAKPLVVLFAANFLARKSHRLRHLTEVTLPLTAVVAFVAFLIYKQPNFSTAALIAATAGLMLFVAEVPLTHLALLAAGGLPALYYLAFAHGYRARRLSAAWWDPLRDAQGASFQVAQALYGIGSGGWLGVGLGSGKQKLGWLPYEFTDMIFAVIAEELGFVGALTVLLLFAVVFWRGLRIAAEAPDRFTQLVAFGLTSMLALQTILNIAVVTASLPPTGIPLPFITYGGSSMIANMGMVGILLAISRLPPRSAQAGGLAAGAAFTPPPGAGGQPAPPLRPRDAGTAGSRGPLPPRGYAPPARPESGPSRAGRRSAARRSSRWEPRASRPE
ncbi:cell division protein FtsW [Caldinitratiruptor microaerophilus]|uniref:Probable peptidoglycan glycosyltransferase FtsW n=1 Tax=Caldinitratiruptor microaerophilus TaxID=671077 RepID=A0AA35CHH3_9FIRM|nr:cell division protein FtsW [Caldinitratiruptor microaerophilus]